ncbi:uncharacterized protein [Nicotiana tomentosiformis]|uniref:uncharacterized protein n=1 Tax=Nicotiana tomentosiformis TaxID=4098 RepID=UPI00388CA655
MIFENVNQFRKAVTDYAIEYHGQLKLKPNEPSRVRVKCKSKICQWEMFASLDRDSNFIVKKYHPIHKCTLMNKNKLYNSKYIANKFKDRITSQPYIRIWEIQELVRNKLGLYVSRTICYRANQIVLRKFMGDWKLEFARLCEYADIITQTNPGSTSLVKINRNSEPGKNLFKYFYVYFNALKKGWLEGCRKIIGFDGCFLKGTCKSELLVAIGENGDQQIYPIA